MLWIEAYKRALKIATALVVISLANFLILGIGATLVVNSQNPGSDSGLSMMIAGVSFFIAGFVFTILSCLAVFIKVITDAVTDHVIERIRNERMNI